MSTNQALAAEIVARLRAAGVRTWCLCPGGRNAPLVEVLEAQPRDSVEVLSFFDERCAGFFAFGRARRDLRPVAIVTTSGTAAAELLPAMIEAYYSAVPIVAVTADRPRAYRRSGSPQSIEQVDLFGVYATVSIDVEDRREVCDLPPFYGPAHLNVCFSEPLLDGWQTDDGPAEAAAGESEVASRKTPAAVSRTVPARHADAWADAEDFLARARQPLVIAGGLQDAADSQAALAFCRALGAPVMAEASSGIRQALGPLLLRAGDAAALRGFDEQVFDSVIRIGDVPSFRVWRDLDLSLTQPVLSISRKPWRGLTRGVQVQVPAGRPLLPPEPGIRRPDPPSPQHGVRLALLYEWDRLLCQATDRLLASHPDSEPALVRRLSEEIPPGAFVYLGNSLPIREWNQFATCADRGVVFGENRGANGIDGQVASFLGWARPDIENWAVVGDLTALYDLSALWALRHLEGTRVRLVVINNGGGRIFKRMFRNERFQNRHATGFEGWASMWEADYHAGWPRCPLGPAAVIELRPDEAQTDAVWAALAEETRR